MAKKTVNVLNDLPSNFFSNTLKKNPNMTAWLVCVPEHSSI